MRRGGAAARPEWGAMVKAAEGILGREWRELGVSYAVAAQGIRTFRKRAPNSPEMQAFVADLDHQLSNGHI